MFLFREAAPARGHERVYIPGEPERLKEEEHRKNGIALLDKVIDELNAVCEDSGTEFLL